MDAPIIGLKPKVVCPCSNEDCKVFGMPRTSHSGHVKGCSCVPCAKGETRKRGLKHQVNGAKVLGFKTSSLRPGNEENLGGTLRFEWKSELPVGPRKVKGKIQNLFEWYQGVEKQSEQQRPHGDNRPFTASASLVGEPYDLIVIRSDKLSEILEAIAEQRSR